MELREIETLVCNPYFEVILSTVREGGSAQYRVGQLGVALYVLNGLDAMQRDCGSLSYGAATKAKFSTRVIARLVVFLISTLEILSKSVRLSSVNYYFQSARLEVRVHISKYRRTSNLPSST